MINDVYTSMFIPVVLRVICLRFTTQFYLTLTCKMLTLCPVILSRQNTYFILCACFRHGVRYICFGQSWSTLLLHALIQCCHCIHFMLCSLWVHVISFIFIECRGILCMVRYTSVDFAMWSHEICHCRRHNSS